jgi:release factor glutamine methyltransferase
MAKSVQGLYRDIVLNLNALYPADEARAMTDRLFEHIFGLSPVQRVIAGHKTADTEKIVMLEAAADKLVNHVPLQYVIGKAWFMDLELMVNESVLIPRPETEELVSLILKTLSGRDTNSLKIIDIGTGSGCIAIALKYYLPDAKVTAIDISENALKVASANAKRNNVEIDFIKSDILDPSQWGLLLESDLIVSNPPYVTDSEKQLMQLNVLNYEPHTALFVPDDDPLRFYEAITHFSENKLSANGQLWFEINESYSNEVLALFDEEIFPVKEVFRDMAGKPRFTFASK